MISKLKQIIEAESTAIKNIPIDNNLIIAIEAILDNCHTVKKGKVICSGMGKAGQIALNIATTFCSTGTPAVFLHPSEAQHGDLGILQENDIMILISNSGKTREVTELIKLAKNLNNKIPVIAITRNEDSHLAKNADITILTGKTVEVCPFGLTPTVSTTVITVIGDLLVAGVMSSSGFTIDDYAKRHHGGYLGEQSRNSKI